MRMYVVPVEIKFAEKKPTFTNSTSRVLRASSSKWGARSWQREHQVAVKWVTNSFPFSLCESLENSALPTSLTGIFVFRSARRVDKEYGHTAEGGQARIERGIMRNFKFGIKHVRH